MNPYSSIRSSAQKGILLILLLSILSLLIGIFLGLAINQHKNGQPEVSKRQYQKSLFYNGEIPVGWCAIYKTEAAFGTVTEFNSNGYFNRNDTDWGEISLQRRSGKFVQSTVEKDLRESPDIQSFTKNIAGKLFQITQYPPDTNGKASKFALGTRVYYTYWGSVGANGKKYDMGIILKEFSSNGMQDPHHEDVEHFLETIDWKRFEEDYLSSIAPFYVDKSE